MKNNKGWLIGLIGVLLIGVSTLNIAYAQDLSDWQDKWFKLTYRTTGYCQDGDDLDSSRAKSTVYLKTNEWDGSALAATLHYYDYTARGWTSIDTPLSFMIGNDSDFVCSLEYQDDQKTVSFAARIKGIKIDGDLKVGAFATLSGLSLSYDAEGPVDCVHQLTMIGTLIKESKVPLPLLN